MMNRCSKHLAVNAFVRQRLMVRREPRCLQGTFLLKKCIKRSRDFYFFFPQENSVLNSSWNIILTTVSPSTSSPICTLDDRVALDGCRFHMGFCKIKCTFQKFGVVRLLFTGVFHLMVSNGFKSRPLKPHREEDRGKKHDVINLHLDFLLAV